ncbi:MAG: hypothetical protein ACFFAX_00200 [Promethearchaeota archaeon]
MEQLTHRPSYPNLEWNESYYFAFYDKNQKFGGMSRVGFKPNKKEGMTFLFMFLPDGSAAAFHAKDDGGSYPESLRVEGMSHRPIKSDVWCYRFDGPLVIVEDPETLPRVREEPELISDMQDAEMDLYLYAINEPYEYSEHMTPESLEMGKKSGDMHWEQIGEVRGTVRIGEIIYEIDGAMGQRDHTHGIRDWTGIGNWFYFVIWFDEHLCVNPAAIVGENGKLGSGGFLFKDGQNIPILQIRLLNHEFRDDGLFPVRTEMELMDVNGIRHTLYAEPGPIIPVPFEDHQGRQSVLVQSFGNFTLDGREGGYGTYETLRKGE